MPDLTIEFNEETQIITFLYKPPDVSKHARKQIHLYSDVFCSLSNPPTRQQILDTSYSNGKYKIIENKENVIISLNYIKNNRVKELEIFLDYINNEVININKKINGKLSKINVNDLANYLFEHHKFKKQKTIGEIKQMISTDEKADFIIFSELFCKKTSSTKMYKFAHGNKVIDLYIDLTNNLHRNILNYTLYDFNFSTFQVFILESNKKKRYCVHSELKTTVLNYNVLLANCDICRFTENITIPLVDETQEEIVSSFSYPIMYDY
jgi:hypothetical protein